MLQRPAPAAHRAPRTARPAARVAARAGARSLAVGGTLLLAVTLLASPVSAAKTHTSTARAQASLSSAGAVTTDTTLRRRHHHRHHHRLHHRRHHARVTTAPKTTTVTRTPSPPTSGTPATAGFSFGLWSFNVLGSNHTDGKGTGFATGVVRAGRALNLLNANPVSVVGTQETQPDQLGVLTRDGTWASYPTATASSNDTATAVLWRTGQWQLVSATTFDIPFLTQQRPEPVVVLRNKGTGRLVRFMNVHLTPKRKTADGQALRNKAIAIIIGQLKTLRTSSVTDPTNNVTYAGAQVPLFLTGDMNEHQQVMCDLTAQGLVSAPGGGWRNGACYTDRTPGIDWIFGDSHAQFSWFQFLRDAVTGAITDHAIARSTAVVPALG